MAIPRCNWGKMTSDLKQKDFPKALLNGIGYGMAIVIGILLGLYTLDKIEIIPETKIQYESIEQRQELNPDNVLFWLNYFEVQHPDWVLCQSIQECGWKYESYRAQNYHSIFGFETGKEILTFGHWIGSVVYYKKWQDAYYTGGDYLEFLDTYGYAADSLYTEKLQIIHSIIFNENNMNEDRFTANEVDAMYFAGVFSSGGLDRLIEVAQSYKNRGLLPHEVLFEVKRKKEAEPQPQTPIKNVWLPLEKPEEFIPAPGGLYNFIVRGAVPESQPPIMEFKQDPGELDDGCLDCDMFTVEDGCSIWKNCPNCLQGNRQDKIDGHFEIYKEGK